MLLTAVTSLSSAEPQDFQGSCQRISLISDGETAFPMCKSGNLLVNILKFESGL